MKKLALLFLIAFVATPAIISQKTVVGTVDYSYKIVGEGAEAMSGMMPEKMVIVYGKNGMTMLMQGGMMASAMGKTVVNGETGETFMVKDSEKTIYTIGNAEIAAEAKKMKKPEFQKLEETKTILGYICNKYITRIEVKGSSMEQTLWVSSELKLPDYEDQVFRTMTGQGAINFDIEGFPMLIEIDMPGMPVKLELQVTNIDFGRIHKSVFEKPKDYKEKPFSEMKFF